MYDLSNKIILIFGGTGELMSNIGIELLQQNASIIVIGRNVDTNSLLNKFIITEQIEFIKFDILHDDINELFGQIYDKYKYIDMIINGAGINSNSSFLNITSAEINNIFEIKLTNIVPTIVASGIKL